MSKLNKRKATGPDGVPAWVLKSCASELARPLKQLFNRCLVESKAPLIWKRGEVIPVPKAPRINKLEDLRPITKTPIVGKIIQRYISKQLSAEFANKQDPLQFGLTSGKATTEALITLWDFILKACDSRKQTAVFVYLLDFSSAFDSILHGAIIEAMICQQAPRWLINWTISFLSNRSQFVRFGNGLSTLLAMLSGVPQGEPISSILFNIVTFSIAIRKIVAILVKFADDRSLAKIIRSLKDHEEYQKLAKFIENEGKAKGLSLNPTKCHEMRIDFSKSKFTKNYPALMVNGETIDVVKSATLLGVEISSDLKWHAHVAKCERKANIRLRDLYRIIRSGLPTRVAEKFVNCNLYPALTYACPVFFNGLLECDMNVFRKIDRRVERALQKKLHSFEERCLQICSVMREKLKVVQIRDTGYSLRKQHVDIPFARTERYKRSFYVAESYGKQISHSVI